MIRKLIQGIQMIKYLLGTLLLSSIALMACPMEGKCKDKDKTACHEKCKKECPKDMDAKSCPLKDAKKMKKNCDYHQSKPITK